MVLSCAGFARRGAGMCRLVKRILSSADRFHLRLLKRFESK